MSAREGWHEEKQSAFLYRVLAEAESGNARARLFSQLADSAEKQAGLWEERLRAAGQPPPHGFEPDTRAKLAARLIRTFGGRSMRPMLAALKVRGLSLYSVPSLSSGHAMPTTTSPERRHRAAASGGSLRAAVFGMNDGLVSNTSLILGVAGASAGPNAILIAGVAGLLAGAFSMAAGEYVSVLSQRELFEHQIALERAELAEYPEEEAEELALVYRARGLDDAEAKRLASRVMSDPQSALDALAREELGLDPDDLGSPWGAAGSSFAAFAVGALVPLAPFLVFEGTRAVLVAAAIAALALFGVGAALSLFTNKSAWASGLRMLSIGALAGGATWAIGKLFGVAVG
ncbi:MAG: VIT1/CCC1 transporter family protein [Planctomycetes bacterium]|nr:VIT1/CCC1 transporter family protein [Planctomycetota bacterium]